MPRGTLEFNPCPARFRCIRISIDKTFNSQSAPRHALEITTATDEPLVRPISIGSDFNLQYYREPWQQYISNKREEKMVLSSETSYNCIIVDRYFLSRPTSGSAQHTFVSIEWLRAMLDSLFEKKSTSKLIVAYKGPRMLVLSLPHGLRDF